MNLRNFAIQFYKMIIVMILSINTAFSGDFLVKIDNLHQKYLKEEIKLAIENVDDAINSVIKIPDMQRKRLAVLIALSSKQYNIDPRIMISIIYVESSFRQNAKSNTGDFSIAQINFKVWEKSFIRLKKKPLSFTQLKEDETYAIFRMGEILSFLQKEYSNKDKYWFALYHSATPKYKKRYIGMLQKPMKKLIKYGPNMIKHIPDDPDKVVSIYFGKETI